MNKELLTKFQLQAGGSHYPGINPQIQAKFAELIVRECLAQVDKVNAMLDNDKEKTGVAWVGLAIAKHFGIEE
jgi:hypothetical protein